MAQIIERIVRSKYPPRDTGVLWLDTKDDLLKAFTSNGWTKVLANTAINNLRNAGYLFAGIATIDTNPETPDAKVFYIANGKGTYTNFGNIEVTEDEVVVLKYDTAWHKEATGIASQEKLSKLYRYIGLVEELKIKGFIQNSNIWSSKGSSYVIPVNAGDIIQLIAGDNQASFALTTNFPDRGTLLTWMGGFSGRINVSGGNSWEGIATEDGFLIVNSSSTNDIAIDPKSLIINGYTLKPTAGELCRTNESDIDDLNDKIGDIKLKDINKRSLTWTNGGMRGAVGKKISSSTSTAYRHTSIPVTAGNKYYIRTRVTLSTNYPAFVHWTDADDVIVRREVGGSETMYVTTALVAPQGSSFLYVTCFGTDSYASNCFIADNASVYAIQSQLNYYGQLSMYRELPEISAFAGRKSVDAYINFALAQLEKGLVDAAIEKVASLNGDLSFAFITDTHQGARYLERNLSSERSIRVFADRLSRIGSISFVAHGGDVCSDYGLGRDSYLNYLYDTIGMIGIPVMVAKGNHDANVDRYVIAPKPYDFDVNTYYLLSSTNTFTEVVSANDYDGVATLYTLGSAVETLISDKEFCKIATLPSSAVVDSENPTGAYYYVDYSDFRIVVINNFMVTDDHTAAYNSTPTGRQFAWLAKVALQTDKKVIIIGHESVEDFNADNKVVMNAILTAFSNGTSVSGTIYGLDYNADFSSFGGGNLVAYLHGHSHTDTYINTNGYNDIGVNASLRPFSDFGTENNYVISIYTIKAGVIHETRIGVWSDTQRTQDRSFSWPIPSELT